MNAIRIIFLRHFYVPPEFLRYSQIPAHDKSICDILISRWLNFYFQSGSFKWGCDDPALRIRVNSILQPTDAFTSWILMGLNANTITSVTQWGSSEIWHIVSSNCVDHTLGRAEISFLATIFIDWYRLTGSGLTLVIDSPRVFGVSFAQTISDPSSISVILLHYVQ
jgi:hypothetical protein